MAIVLRKISVLIIFLFITIVKSKNLEDRILSREKRYLVFPEGSSLSIAICMTAQTGITPGEIFTEGINWGISYELPNDTKPFKELSDKPKELMQRRHRRELYFKMERIMNSMGYNGRTCILRALCEATRLFKPKGDSLIDEILRIVFRYPKRNNHEKEDKEDHHFYNKASQKEIKYSEEECFDMFPGCPFSLIDLALGYYSAFGYYPDT